MFLLHGKGPLSNKSLNIILLVENHSVNEEVVEHDDCPFKQKNVAENVKNLGFS
jgi:hypothetical protein